jgi:hypothetical protein
MKLTGETEVLGGKTCPSTTLSTINPTWTNPGSNTCLRGERPATNRLSHGTGYNRVMDYFYRILYNRILLNFLLQVSFG